MKRIIHLLLPLLLFAGCKEQTVKSTADREERRIERENERKFQTLAVKEHEVAGEMLLSGEIVADERRVSRVVVPISGKVEGMSAETGDEVNRGQRLCTVLSTEATTHQRDLLAAEAEVRLAQRELTVKESLQNDGMVSEREVAEARERLRMAEATLRQQQGINHIISLAPGGGSAGVTLSSPLSGTVLSRRVTPNQFVEAGEEAFLIADLSQVWAVADVYENDISRIREGATVAVETMAWPSHSFTGHIDKVYGALDAESKTLKVRVNLQNPEHRLRPGMFATVHVSLQGQEAKRLPCIPPRAAVFENGHHYVILADGDTYHRQEIKIAIESDSLLYIAEGLRTGQRVVGERAILLFNELGQ